MTYIRPHASELEKRILEPRRLIQVVAGPRQVGKTTLVRQVCDRLRIPFRYATADEPFLKGRAWIDQQWDLARLENRTSGAKGSVLILDEIQKISGWSETVKRLWDEDTHAGSGPKVILLGSAPLLIGKGLSESLAGRFEIMHLGHWPYFEMKDAFHWSIDEFLFHGGYPGAAPLIGDPQRWTRYILDSLVETTLSRDVLLLTRVDKPALLRRLFDLCCAYSGQILSYNKMLGQLLDAGNTTTLAHYLELLAGAGMATGLQKFAGETARIRASSPKLQVYNTALIGAQCGLALGEAKQDGRFWGRLVESAVGAHLVNAATSGAFELFYWREGNREVDFVVRKGQKVTAIEVKSSRAPERMPGMEAFSRAFRVDRTILVGGDGIPLEVFLGNDPLRFLA